MRGRVVLALAGLLVAGLALGAHGPAAAGNGPAVAGSRVVHLPPSARPYEVIGITGAEAALIGLVNPRGEFTEVVFQYGRSARFGSELPEAIEEEPYGRREVEVAQAFWDLRPNTTYYFRVVATNRFGTAYSQPCAFTTAPRLSASAPSRRCGPR